MALFGPRIDVNETEGSDLALGPDNSIQTCTGRFENGAIFEFRDGKPFVQGASAPNFVEGSPREVEQIKAALEAKFGERRIKLESSGRFILLNTAEKSDAQKAVDALRNAATKSLNRVLGTDVKRVRDSGMMSLARHLLEQGKTFEEVKLELRTQYSDEKNLDELIPVALAEAQSPKSQNEMARTDAKALALASSIATQRRAGKTEADIRTDLAETLQFYTLNNGSNVERSSGEIQDIITAAFEELKARHDARAFNAKLKSQLPFTAERKWDESMRAKGAFRLARLRREEASTNPALDEDSIRAELEQKLSAEADPEAMAAYVLSQIADASFNAGQALLTAKEQFYDRAARTQVDAGQSDGQIEAALMAAVKTPDMSSAEAQDIARAAIQLARAAVRWEGQKETAWDITKGAAKVAAVGTGALALAGAAATVLGTAFGLKKLWGLGKKVAPYVWPVTKTVGVGVAKGLSGTVKLARNALIYAPATMLWTPFKRTYEGLRAAKNYPNPPTYYVQKQWWKKPGQWMANGVRGLWWRSKQAAALAVALPLALTFGTFEGAGRGVGHQVLGTEWNGSTTVDDFMNEYKHHRAPQVSESSSSGSAPAAPATGGSHGGH